MRRLSARSFLGTVLLLGLVWWALSDGAPSSWIIGVPTITAVTLWHLSQQAASKSLPRLLGLAGFIPYFLWESLRGGIDVARLAIATTMRISPHFTRFALRLPEGPARRVFINTVSLLPGTLSADLQGDQLIVHRLRGAPNDNSDLNDCEQRVARLYGLSLSDNDRAPSVPEAPCS
ncbi:Na+/H+ antiporter subunit E [Halomonas sp. GXIMD04776]|uniref:Na+/H+ antiporter subunit E n=1 Tax=Halomonas sp. GXIMD04776 TaxID=3415605 RepID=UPI003C8A1049